MTERPKTLRGFAAMDSAKHREAASKGGRTTHAKGRAHKFSREEAIVAGRKGGLATSQNREHMSLIGRRGAFARIRAHAGCINEEA